MKPALTAEEWSKLENGSAAIGVDGSLIIGQPDKAEWALPEDRHGVAALALHGQSFGFTREDVRACRNDVNAYVEDRDEMLRSLADRIEDLLPPKG